LIRVLDTDERRYGLALVRRAGRAEVAIASAIDARNQALADAAERVLRAGHVEDVLCADLRFVVDEYSFHLVEKLVKRIGRSGDWKIR